MAQARAGAAEHICVVNIGDHTPSLVVELQDANKLVFFFFFMVSNLNYKSHLIKTDQIFLITLILQWPTFHMYNSSLAM